MEFLVYADGGTANKNGNCYYSFRIIRDGIVRHVSREIEKCTNNVTEYHALYNTLKELDIEYELSNSDKIHIMMDSQLVVNQISGIYQVNATHLIFWRSECRKLIKKLKSKKCFIELVWVPRKQIFQQLNH